MGKIDRYILKSMALPTVFGVSLFTFIFLIDILVEMMEKIIVKNISPLMVFEMISYYLPPIVVNTIPMGLFLGVMMSYSTLSNNSEIVAMESIGMGMKRFFMPAFIFGLLVTVFIFFVEEKVVPSSYTRLLNLTKRIAVTKPAVQMSAKVFVEGIGDYNIYIDSIDNEKNEATNIIALKKTPEKVYPEIVMSKKALWRKEKMILKDAVFYNYSNKGEKELEGSFDKQDIPISTLFGDINDESDKDSSMMGITEIYKEIKTRQKNNLATLKYEIDFNQMIVIPLSAVLLATLGVLLSVSNARTGKGVSFGVSLVVIFLYIMGINLCRMLANKMVMPPYAAMWIPNIMLIIFTIIMFIKKAGKR